MGTRAPERRIPFPGLFLTGAWGHPSLLPSQRQVGTTGTRPGASPFPLAPRLVIVVIRNTSTLRPDSTRRANLPSAPRFWIPFRLFMFRDRNRPFLVIQSDINPDSGGRSPASGMYARPPLSYEGTGCEIPIRPPDISLHGMFVNISTHFPEGAIVQLRFRLTRSNVEVQTRAEVRYCLPGIGIGVEFVGMDPKMSGRSKGNVGRFPGFVLPEFGNLRRGV